MWQKMVPVVYDDGCCISRTGIFVLGKVLPSCFIWFMTLSDILLELTSSLITGSHKGEPDTPETSTIEHKSKIQIQYSVD